MWVTIGARWQPYPAAEIIEPAFGLITDPSAPKPWKISKIVIDATKQWPEEGGPKDDPELNRMLLREGMPACSPWWTKDMENCWPDGNGYENIGA